jgi:proteasome activator subunit 4
MALDGPVRVQDSATGFVAGSRALDSLDKLITSVESFFHPSNAGQWTLIVSSKPSDYSLLILQRV